MNNLTNPKQFAKSPLIFLLLVGILVIATLVTASEYFLRPHLELELKKKITHGFSQADSANAKTELSDQNLILNGTVLLQATITKTKKTIR